MLTVYRKNRHIMGLCQRHNQVSRCHKRFLIFQALQSGSSEEIEHIYLTASGGPFRHFTAEELRTVTVEQALAHPNWNMGKKITIDSATMINKGQFLKI